MTKKNNQAISQDNDQDLKDLQDMLEDVKADKADDNHDMVVKLKAEISKLNSQLAEKDEIVKNAQLAYLRTKNDMDMIQHQAKMKSETMHQDLLMKIVKKLLPFVEDLRKSLANLTDEQKDSPMWKWIQILYDKFINTLAEFKVFPIPSMHKIPDTMMHEPIGIQPTNDKKLKWKIIQIFEQGFYYENEDSEKITIIPSKVIVGE